MVKSMRMVANNTILNYRLSGKTIRSEGKVVILLHGWGRTLEDFDELSQRLAAEIPDATFIQIDLPGFGESPLAKTEGFSLTDYCATLRSILDKMEIGRVVLVGHSLGGRIAMRFAALHPERVDKLILISAAGILSRSIRTFLLGLGRRLFQTVFCAVGDFGPMLRLKNLLGATFGSKDYQTSHGALRETLKKVLAEDLRPDAARIKIPTLLIWGAQDQITPLRDGQEYQGLIRGSRLEILDGGHFAFLEHPEECVQRIASFLQDR